VNNVFKGLRDPLRSTAAKKSNQKMPPLTKAAKLPFQYFVQTNTINNPLPFFFIK
jgi:hypothetical protein